MANITNDTEQRMTELVTFLNGVFGRGTSGLFATIGDDSEIDIKRGDYTQYIVQPSDNHWYVNQLVCISGDRDTPEHSDSRELDDATSDGAVARIILLEEARIAIENQIEWTCLELNPEDGVFF